MRIFPQFRHRTPSINPPPSHLIVGLGNPGPEYAFTRHNIGWRVIELLGRRLQITINRPECRGLVGIGSYHGETVLLLKPLTYMNRSGISVKEAMRRYQLTSEQVIIVCDDIYLPLGKLRLRFKGRTAGHNGLGSVLETLGTDEIACVRVGVGEAPPGQMRGYVLSCFEPEEEATINEAIDRATEALVVAIQNGFESAMQRFNR
ncbi:MAG: aminoacyl-tRNA hydrolase [Armatimonadetes bacterium]|nr:aminoacyl-tRNA hydrolase [Armatimonadota bacterium]